MQKDLPLFTSMGSRRAPALQHSRYRRCWCAKV